MADMDDKFDPSNPSHRSSLIFMADILDEHFLTKSFVQSVLVENEHEVHFPASENQHTYIDANIGFNVLSKEPTLSTDEKSSSRGTLSHRIARAGFSAPTINTGQINSANVASTLDNQPTYLTISPNNTPSAFVDSPVLLSNSLVQLSPTTGKFSLPLHGFSSLPISTLGSTIVENCKGECPDETMPGGIPFQPPSDTTALYCSSLEAKISFPTENIEKNIQNDFSGPCCIKDPVNDISENSSPPEAEYNGEDGYNWRKYGQKHVKGSEYPRGYYKCTHPNCPVKKKVERSHEGYITEIIYSRKHNHEIPVKKCRSGIPPFQLYYNKVDTSTMYGESSLVVFGDNSSSTLNQDVLNISSSNSVDELEDEETQASIGTEGDGVGDENESNRRNLDACGVEMNIGARAGRDSRIVVQTVSEIDVLDDGYKWRKYGQKVVKGNPNPRNYYKCTSAGCSVRKHVERASNDLASVITTYEGKHNHEVPAARNLIHHPAAAYPSQALIRRHPEQPQDPVMSLNPPTVLNNFNLSSSNYRIRPLGLNNIEIGGGGQMGQVRFPLHDPNHYYSANIGADGVVLPEKMATEVYEQFMSTHHPLGPFEPHGP